MNLERTHQILEEICNEPHQSADSVLNNVSKNKSLHPAERGDTSELVLNYLIGLIDNVEKVTPFHQFIYGIDCDSRVTFSGTKPVFLQIKTTEKAARSFKHKLATFKEKTGETLRIVTLSSETAFNGIIEDFVDQVNTLEGRRYLYPVKFTIEKPRKRKSYLT